MLARRFTIVCLVTTLFGMVFATLAADAGRQPRLHANGSRLPCLLDAGQHCAAPFNR